MHQMKRTGFIILVLAAVIGVTYVIRTRTLDRDAFMKQEAEAMRDRTVPNDSQVLVIHALTRTEVVAQASWEIGAKMEWKPYRAWVQKQLPSDYPLVSSTDDSVVFVKQLPGDVETLSIDRLPGEGPTRVRVTFRGQPN